MIRIIESQDPEIPRSQDPYTRLPRSETIQTPRSRQLVYSSTKLHTRDLDVLFLRTVEHEHKIFVRYVGDCFYEFDVLEWVGEY